MGSDAFDVALEPSEARLLLPFVLGLAGEFDNAAVQGAATNLFTVSSLHMLSWSPGLFSTEDFFVRNLRTYRWKVAYRSRCADRTIG